MTIDAEKMFRSKKVGNRVEFGVDGILVRGILLRNKGILRVELSKSSQENLEGLKVFSIGMQLIAADGGIQTKEEYEREN